MNLETKRNAIMNAIASGQIPNIVANNLTWASGFFSSGGGISTASATTKEMYEQEYIEVDTTDKYLIVIDMPNSTSYWCGIAQYQNDETFANRVTPVLSVKDGVGYSYAYPFTQPKIRISTRTYGEANIGLYKYSDIINYLGDMAEVIWE